MDHHHGIRQVQPTYRLEPTEENRFRPSQVRDICESVVKQHLEGKEWDPEEETVWTAQITDEVKDKVKGKRSAHTQIVAIIQSLPA